MLVRCMLRGCSTPQYLSAVGTTIGPRLAGGGLPWGGAGAVSTFETTVVQRAKGVAAAAAWRRGGNLFWMRIGGLGAEPVLDPRATGAWATPRASLANEGAAPPS